MPDKEENEEKKEEGKEEGAGEKDSGEVQKKPFDNLDLNVWRCFGIQHPKSKSWVSLCVRS